MPDKPDKPDQTDHPYIPSEIEARWQQEWRKADLFRAGPDTSRPKYYVLEMLPYPSGTLHMGHMRNYSIGDALARYKWMQGFRVLHPMGWDSFGLPAENAAIKNNRDPGEWTRSNIAAMRRQLDRFGFSYDWSTEMSSCEPEYYRWNQWFFLKMFERGIAYRKIPIRMYLGLKLPTANLREMVRRTGGDSTIPQIFVDGQYLGDDDTLLELARRGELESRLGAGTVL